MNQFPLLSTLAQSLRVRGFLLKYKKTLLSLLAFLFLFFIISSFHYYRTHIATENGYVNAYTIQIAAQISGPVQTVHIENNQAIKANSPLFDIEPGPFLLAIKQATAQVSQTEAHLKNVDINFKRILKLVEQKFLPPEEKDNALAAVEIAAANFKLAQAKLEEANLNLTYTKVCAPTDGHINNFSLRPGTIVRGQMPLFVLVNNQKFWVDANFKETELTNIRKGQTATIVLDMYPDHKFKGIVESISQSSGTAFSLLPPQNATGNWVKVTQRIPVKVLMVNPDPRYPLRIGSTATVTINTTHHPASR